MRGNRPHDPPLAELAARIAAEDPTYPHSDGKPLAESEPHLQCIRWLLDAVEDALQGTPNVSFHGDMFWYSQEGRPDLRRAPDVMVLFGVPMDPIRLSYKAWEHGSIVPAVIIETASAEQQDKLLGELRDDYERLGVREYFVFDWSGDYLEQQLYGFRLGGRGFRSIRASADGWVLSRELNVNLRPEQRMLRFADVQSTEPILTRSEQLAAQQRALVSQDARLAQQAAELDRARALLRKAGIDPDATK
jgi:Uma2 family endonuclease